MNLNFASVLQGALKEVEGLKDSALRDLVAEYAPRLESLVVSANPQQEYDDIMVNVRLIGDILGVEAQSVPYNAAGAALRTAAGLALKVAVVA